jgi:hypothetical protein
MSVAVPALEGTDEAVQLTIRLSQLTSRLFLSGRQLAYLFFIPYQHLHTGLKELPDGRDLAVVTVDTLLERRHSNPFSHRFTSAIRRCPAAFDN